MTPEYTREIEHFLKTEGEMSEGYALLHTFASERNLFLTTMINIPIIILSSIVGIVAFSNIIGEYSNLFVGIISVLISFFKTIDTYYQHAKMAETHRLTSLQYIKINKSITVQLALFPNMRVPCATLMTNVQNDLSSIRESEPIITQSIINKFNDRYKDYPNVAKPPICNGLTSITINNEPIEVISH